MKNVLKANIFLLLSAVQFWVAASGYEFIQTVGLGTARYHPGDPEFARSLLFCRIFNAFMAAFWLAAAIHFLRLSRQSRP